MNRKCCLLLALFLFAAMPVFAASCEGLAGLKLPNATITLAQQVAAGAFVPPGAGAAMAAAAKNLPAFCRVTATISPVQDSEIKIEVWMPLTGWNGRYRGQGTGGFAGSIDYSGLGTALSAGYASASTDTGHAASPIDSAWALGHPEKIVDFGWRAIHEMTVKAKAIIQAFYGEAPSHSYFAGCSNGGRQALMEAQRFPEDYDGILAGAPANYWTRVFATFIHDIQAMQATPDSFIGPEKIPAIAKAVVAACDAEDGVKDGVLNDPRTCTFDPKALLCKQGDSPDCLTEAQAAALNKIYDGPFDSRHRRMYPGFEPGGEEGQGGWVTWIDRGPGKDLQSVFASGFFTNMIKAERPIDLKTISAEAAVQLADAQQGRTLNADNPNLKAFAAHGGKLIIYHGWSDAALPPLGAIDYYHSVQAGLGKDQAASFVRLFMVPGLQHCLGGPGADSFGQLGPVSDAQHDIRAALEQWVEKGTTPEGIIATKYVDGDRSKGVKMTRPLCAFPQIAKYKGSGDVNDAANFACVKGEDEIIFVRDPSVTAPRPLYTPDPKYAKSASKQKIQGVVKLSVVIGVDGKVHNAKVLESVDPSLDAKALEAVKKWRFEPAKAGGHPVAVQMVVEVYFKLY